MCGRSVAAVGDSNEFCDSLAGKASNGLEVIIKGETLVKSDA